MFIYFQQSRLVSNELKKQLFVFYELSILSSLVELDYYLVRFIQEHMVTPNVQSACNFSTTTNLPFSLSTTYRRSSSTEGENLLYVVRIQRKQQSWNLSELPSFLTSDTFPASTRQSLKKNRHFWECSQCHKQKIL